MMTKLKNGPANIVRTKIFHCRWDAQCAKVKNLYSTRIYFGEFQLPTFLIHAISFNYFFSVSGSFIAGWVRHSKSARQTTVQLNRPVWVCHKPICRHVDHRRDTNPGHVRCAPTWIRQSRLDAPNVRINEMLAPNHPHMPPISCRSKSMHWVYEMPPNRKRMLLPSIEQVHWARTVCRAREQIWAQWAHASVPWPNTRTKTNRQWPNGVVW